jgi:hypothetical protein
MAGGNLETAVNFYFDMGANLPAPRQTPPPPASVPPPPPAGNKKPSARVYPDLEYEDDDDIPDIGGLAIQQHASGRPGRQGFDEDGIRKADPARVQRLYDGRGMPDSGFLERDMSGSKDEAGVDWMYALQTELCYPGDLTAVNNAFTETVLIIHVCKPLSDFHVSGEARSEAIFKMDPS